MSKEIQPVPIKSLDEAIMMFKRWVEKGDFHFDELDLKEYLVDEWLPEMINIKRKPKNGWNAKGHKR